ncbi:unknown [Spodoptera litura nucleopolyhedrovirus II]|uniref:hypothetical protein n=1 Tax=Spodoptera litura nucleopolyhedrovirus II TaxID=566270 RepID=UPI0001874658|nr:hypothetical protein SlnV2_gp026 [Spodoptera litura nucleopolyhedrovirus II]ACI47395.1 unknown [Spodoptera litura nucleopolyhedrovirus II]
MVIILSLYEDCCHLKGILVILKYLYGLFSFCNNMTCTRKQEIAIALSFIASEYLSI